MSILDFVLSLFSAPHTPVNPPIDTPIVVSSTEPSPTIKAQGWSKSLDDCHAKIKETYPLVAKEFLTNHPDCTFRMDYTWRSAAFQFELYKQGRELQNGVWVVVDKSKVVTDKDGTQPSHHQTYPSQAADIYIVKDGKILWDDTLGLYTEVGKIWLRYGLVSGAIWSYNWKDVDHVQISYIII